MKYLFYLLFFILCREIEVCVDTYIKVRHILYKRYRYIDKKNVRYRD